jgi:hypothetical protein
MIGVDLRLSSSLKDAFLIALRQEERLARERGSNDAASVAGVVWTQIFNSTRVTPTTAMDDLGTEQRRLAGALGGMNASSKTSADLASVFTAARRANILNDREPRVVS